MDKKALRAEIRAKKRALTEAQKTEVFATKNFYLYGSRDDIMDYMEANKDELCTIEDVCLSELMH